MKRLFPNDSITTTKSFAFNLLAYAGQSEDPILLRELEMDTMKSLWYSPPTSRRFGEGTVAESVSFGGWTVGWRDQELKVIVASVSPDRMGPYRTSNEVPVLTPGSGVKGSPTRSNGI